MNKSTDIIGFIYRLLSPNEFGMGNWNHIAMACIHVSSTAKTIFQLQRVSSVETVGHPFQAAVKIECLYQSDSYPR